MTVLARAAGLVLVLVALLTWVLVQSVSTAERQGARKAKAFHDLELADGKLSADLASNRIGIAAYNAVLDRDLDDLQAAVTHATRLLAPDAPVSRNLTAKAQKKADLVRQLQSRNSELQKASSSFTTLGRQLAMTPTDPEKTRALASTLATALRMMQTHDDGAASDLTSQLSHLSELGAPGGDQAVGLSTFVTQGDALAGLVPDVHSLVARGQDLTFTAELRRARFVSFQTTLARRWRVDAFLIALFIAAAIVSLILLRVGFRLRLRGRAMGNMLLVEQLTVRISNLFLACRADAVDRQFPAVLEILGSGCAVDRAWFLATDSSDRRTWRWQARPLAADGFWPEAVRAELDAIEAYPHAAVVWPDKEFVPSASLQTALAAANIRHWACAKVRRSGQTVGLLCFDRSEPFLPGIGAPDTLNMLAEVIGHALVRQDLDRRQRRLEAKLRRAERLEAVGTFASGISHNFNNVLAVINGHLEMASDALPPEASARRHLEEIDQAVHRAQTMVDRILSFGRPDHDDAGRLAVGRVVAEVVTQLRKSAGEACDLALAGAEETILVLASETELQQVFFNVIQNAIQASPPDCRISIQVEAVESPGQPLSHGSLAAGRYARVTVADRGIGIDQRAMARLFQPFFSTKPAGTGLGLATALATVRELGGGIDVHSTSGCGSQFEIWLPEIERAPSCPDTEAGAPLSVILVNPDRRRLLQDEELLAALDFEPIGFADADAALAAAANDATRFDAAIVEHVGVGDLATIDTLRRSLPPDKPVLISTALSEVDVVTLSRIGVHDILRRPWDHSSMSAVLRSGDVIRVLRDGGDAASFQAASRAAEGSTATIVANRTDFSGVGGR